jgi:hypothetical protein
MTCARIRLGGRYFSAGTRPPLFEFAGGLSPKIRTVGQIQEFRVFGRSSEVLSPERQPQRARELAASVTEAARIKRNPVVEFAVNHGARKFRVMSPRAAIQIVRPDGRPDVIDDTDLGVDVDGSAELRSRRRRSRLARRRHFARWRGPALGRACSEAPTTCCPCPGNAERRR